MDTSGFLAELRRERLVAIVRGRDPEASLRAVLTLLEAGVRLVEVSLTTRDAAAVIARAVREAAGTGVSVGAGTVVSRDDLARARDAGAGWFVTPALGPGAEAAAADGLPVLAGAFTPTEAVAAMAGGATAVKLFPAAAAGGPAYLAALRDPLPDIPFVPVGGIDAAAAERYYAAGAVAVGVGTPLVGDAAHTSASGEAELAALRRRARAFLAARPS